MIFIMVGTFIAIFYSGTLSKILYQVVLEVIEGKFLAAVSVL